VHEKEMVVWGLIPGIMEKQLQLKYLMLEKNQLQPPARMWGEVLRCCRLAHEGAAARQNLSRKKMAQ
jgi:hypothetical protein